MSLKAPETLSVKRKRGALPVETLVIENTKRLRSDSYSFKEKQGPPTAGNGEKRAIGDSAERTVVWRRVIKPIPHGSITPSTTHAPPETPTRRFHVSRASGNVVLFEDTPMVEALDSAENKARAHLTIGEGDKVKESSQTVPEQATLRKRPGAGATIKPVDPQIAKAFRGTAGTGPSDETIRELQKLSQDVETEEYMKATPSLQPPSSNKIKPKAPALRYKDRHPERSAKDSNSMDVDSDDFVYDTYVREIILPGADGKVPEPEGTVGFIVLTEKDEEWWFDEDESDREFDTDDEDENAEDYYANDYPEDELSDDDEFDRDPYTYHRGEDDEEYDLDDNAESDVDDKQAFRQTVPKTRATYWGQFGER